MAIESKLYDIQEELEAAGVSDAQIASRVAAERALRYAKLAVPEQLPAQSEREMEGH
jgi:hypothetical protein